MSKPLTVWITTNWKILKEMEYRTTSPVSWEICTQVKKQQLELDIEQQTGSKLGKEHIKAVYWHLAYLTYMRSSVQFSSVSQSCLTATPWTAACQASLSITNSQSLLKLMSIESVMTSNHLILCRPLLFPPSNFPINRVSSNESALCIRWLNYWSFICRVYHAKCWAGWSKSWNQVARRNINSISYVCDTTIMAESEEVLKSLLMKVKKEGEKTGLKFNI